jgi:hypothetical protein
MATEDPRPLLPLDRVTGELEIVKPSWRRGLQEVVAPEGPVARIDASAWSGRSRAEAAAGVWGFSRTRGIRALRVEVTDVDGAPVATLRQSGWTRNGQLDLDGVPYALTGTGVWRRTWTWTAGTTELVRIATRASFRGGKGTVELTDAGRRDPHAALLVLLGLHVVVAAAQAAAAAGAAT